MISYCVAKRKERVFIRGRLSCAEPVFNTWRILDPCREEFEDLENKIKIFISREVIPVLFVWLIITHEFPLTDLPQIKELGRSTGMFLAWYKV